MIEYIIPTLVVVLPSAGFGLGTWWASRGRDQYVDRLKRMIEELQTTISSNRHQAIQFRQIIRTQGRELAEYRASRQRSTAPLRAANAARHAKRLEREAQERLIKMARHKEMRELVGEII